MAKRRRYSMRRFSRLRNRRRGGSKRLRRVIKRTVRRMSEVKYATAFNNIPGGTDPQSAFLVNIGPAFPQGVDKNQRIGNNIRYKNLQLRWSLHLNAAANAIDYLPVTVRVIVFQTRVALSSPSTITDILDVNSFISSVRGNAVRVMYDKMRDLHPTQDPNQHFASRWSTKKNFRIRNNVNFRDSSVLIPTDYKDNYFILIVTSALNGVAGRLELDGSWFSRISFIDV